MFCTCSIVVADGVRLLIKSSMQRCDNFVANIERQR